MTTWTYFVHDSSTGEPLGELPLSDVSFEDVLSGRSTLNGKLSVFDAAANRALTAPWLCEITAVRDVDVPGGSVIGFHGPIVGRIPDRQSGDLRISAASPHAYLYKRVTEAYHQYSRDTFALVRDLVDEALAKTGGGLYRLDYTAADSGTTTALTVGGSDRRRVSQVIEALSADETKGFDFRWDAAWDDLTQRLVQRTLTLGAPTIGQDRSLSRVIEVTAELVGVSAPEDGLAATNRPHALGGLVGTARLRAVHTNTESLAAGYPLLEDPIDLSDVKDQALLDGMAEHVALVRAPGSRTYTTTHVAGQHLPYGAIDTGDTVTVRLTAGVDSIDTTPRVVGIRTVPAADVFTFTYYDPAAA